MRNKFNYIKNKLTKQKKKHNKDIINFYISHSKNWNNVSLIEILHYSNEELENNHCYIQWLFPTKRKSNYANAPILTDEIINYLKQNKQFHKNYKKAFLVMLSFYGFEINGDKIIKSNQWDKQKDNWLNKNNHNYLRLSRIMDSLIRFNYYNYANMLYEILLNINKEYPGCISEDNIRHWNDIVK